MDSVTRPWQDAVADPRGAHVAIARITASGSDLFVMTADRRDTLPLLVGSGDARPLAWSPDGRWLLATVSRTLDDGTFDTDLYALSTHGAVIRRAIDTTARRAVIEAAWSPDGTRIAWVARVGLERQLEVFASDVEGHGLVNLSRHPADDQHITWSPSGDLVAFTSARDGNAELYAASLRENKLWRLTFDPAQDDRAAFSGDARLIAFESTRGGAVGVYVMPALGGDARQIGRASPFSMARWRGAGRYVDRVRVGVPDRVSPGDTARLTLIALDQFEEPVATGTPQWAMLDSGVARLVLDSASGARLVARRSGLARVVGHVGRWRFDTAYVHIGDESVSLLGDTTSPRPAWRPLGVPLPTMTSDANGLIVLRADREWESGMLSRSSVPMLPRLTVAATLELPLGSARDPATSMAISLVAVEDSTAIDVAAPQFLRLVTFAWNADAGRFVYAVGREVFTEAAPTTAALTGLRLLIRIEPDSTVSFGLDGQQRWRSTLRVPDASRQPGAQVWIAGRATGDRVRVGRVRLVLAGRTPNADP
jgi:hypothetical protein